MENKKNEENRDDGVKKERWKTGFDKEAFSQWYYNISMPEIGAGGAIFFGIIALVFGIIVGTQYSLWIQGGILIALLIFNNSWPVRGLELGALSYMIISFLFVLGLIIGDISFFFQTSVEFKTNIDMGNPFKVQ